MNTNIISFPNLGIHDLNINKVAISIFKLDIKWYGIILTLGIVAAVLYVYFKGKKFGVIDDDFLDIAIFTVISGILGARIYYVLTSLEDYNSFSEVIAIWNGGLAIYGAIIGGAAAALIVLRMKKMNILKFFDALAPAVMLGQIIGRWGNFMNGEAYGSVKTFEFFGRFFDISTSKNLPWIMQIGSGENAVLCQPTFLYESLWNLVGFVLINIFYNRKKYDGEILIWYVTWYGFGRMFIEGLRTDSLYIGTIRISQLIGLLCFLCGAFLLILLKIKKYNKERPIYINEKTTEVNENGNNN